MAFLASLFSALASVGKIFGFFSQLVTKQRDQNLVDSGKVAEKADSLQKQVDADAKGNKARDDSVNQSERNPSDIMCDDGFKLPD